MCKYIIMIKNVVWDNSWNFLNISWLLHNRHATKWRKTAFFSNFTFVDVGCVPHVLWSQYVDETTLYCLVEVSHACWCMYTHQAHPKTVCFLETYIFFRKLEENSSILLMYGVLLGAWCATIKIVSKILPRGHVVYSYLILNP